MMTLKLVTADGFRSKIVEAESFTVLRMSEGSAPGEIRRWAEITGHRADGQDFRFDVGQSNHPEAYRIFAKAYVENSHGKTVEWIDYSDCFNAGHGQKAAAAA